MKVIDSFLANNSSITLNITDFDQNVLKNTSDTQVIRAPWTMNRMEILGKTTLTTNLFQIDFASLTNFLQFQRRFVRNQHKWIEFRVRCGAI